jgi:hypothetical protein
VTATLPVGDTLTLPGAASGSGGIASTAWNSVNANGIPAGTAGATNGYYSAIVPAGVYDVVAYPTVTAAGMLKVNTILAYYNGTSWVQLLLADNATSLAIPIFLPKITIASYVGTPAGTTPAGTAWTATVANTNLFLCANAADSTGAPYHVPVTLTRVA